MHVKFSPLMIVFHFEIKFYVIACHHVNSSVDYYYSWHFNFCNLIIYCLFFQIFLQTWEYDVSWLYCIDFLGAEEFDFDTRYRFRVRWSIPTRRKPIPRATASVYFSFVVSKIKPKVYDQIKSSLIVQSL